MILGPDGSKLSKRHGATSVLEYKQQGYLPHTLRNYLALLGWSTSDSQQLFTDEDLIAKFNLEGCQKSPATFDPVKLTWMNGEYMRQLSVKELIDQSESFLKAAGLLPVNGGPSLEKVVALEHESTSGSTRSPPWWTSSTSRCSSPRRRSRTCRRRG